jgi:hypothetical protein
MSPIQEVASGLQTVTELVDEPTLEPDPDRNDWHGLASRVRLVRQTLDKQVLAVVEEAVDAADSPDTRAAIVLRVAEAMGEVAVLLYATQDRKGCVDLLNKAVSLLGTEEVASDLYGAAVGDPEGFVTLQHARWLRRHKRTKEADGAYKKLMRTAPTGPLHELAKSELDGPRPVEGAPTLMTFNGFGTMLYGSRDRWTDGSYIATRFLCALFIPVFPLESYRVREYAARQFEFFTREPLSKVAKLYRVGILVAAAAAVAFFAGRSYLGGASYAVSSAMREGAAAEQAGDRDKAMEHYRSAVWDNHRDTDVSEPAHALMRVSATAFADPCGPTDAEAAGRLFEAFDALPTSVQKGAARDVVVERLLACASQIGEADLAVGRSSLAVLELAEIAAHETPRGEEVGARAQALRRKLAQDLQGTRPLAALALYTEMLDDPQARASALSLIEGLGNASSLWIEAAPFVEAWVQGSGGAAEASRVRERLSAAKQQAAVVEKAIEGADEERLTAMLETYPGNQKVAVALASSQRDRGALTEAIATLTALGIPGRMTGQGQLLLGACHRDAGQLKEADAVLSALLQERLPRYRRAQRAYFRAAEKQRMAYFDNAARGTFPPDIESRLQNTTEDRQLEVYSTWVSEQLERNTRLGALRDEFLRDRAVVPASLAVGTVKLLRASEADEEQRRTLLDEAEQAYLAVRASAEGTPDYHLGLGAVYHRLGRPQEGDAELARVLSSEDFRLHLRVAGQLRELGLLDRARQICERVYAEGDETVKHEAAMLRVRLANTLEDREKWLKRGDPTKEDAELELLNIRALRLVAGGELDAADRVYAQIAERWGKKAKHDAAGANNAALALANRYSCTGDPAHLREAAKNLQTASQLASNSTIVISNYAGTLEHEATVRVLERWMHTRVLRLGIGDADTVLWELLASPLEERISAALGNQPSHRKCLSLMQQQQALAPSAQGSYERTLRWLSHKEDVAGLEKLLSTLAAVGPLDVTEARKDRREFESGQLDEHILKEVRTALPGSEARVERARKDGHAPRIAAALLLHENLLLRRAMFEPSEDGFKQAVSASREAAKLWPEAGLEKNLASTLAFVGVLRARERCPATKQLWEEHGRQASVDMLLHHAMQSPQREAIVATLRAQPEIAEAARLRLEDTTNKGRLFDYELGRVMGDEVLTGRGAGIFGRKASVLSAKVSAALYPGLPRETDRLAALTKGAEPDVRVGAVH